MPGRKANKCTQQPRTVYANTVHLAIQFTRTLLGCCFFKLLESFAPVKIADDSFKKLNHDDGDNHHRNINSQVYCRQEPGACPLQRAQKSVRMACRLDLHIDREPILFGSCSRWVHGVQNARADWFERLATDTFALKQIKRDKGAASH